MREGLAAVLLCTLVVTAGCSALSGSGGNATGEKTEPDAPVDDVDTDGIPGIEDEQLANETALLDAHVEAVTETGYSYERRTNVTDAIDGGTLEVSERQRSSVEAGASEYWIQQVTSAARSSRVTAWGNESTVLLRLEGSGQDPQYRVGASQSPDSLAARTLFELRLSPEFEVTGVDEREDGPAVVTLEADGLPEENEVFDDQEDIENVREYEATLVVDTEGRIHSYTASARYDIEGETGDYEISFRMTGFEDPDVERPEWAAEISG